MDMSAYNAENKLWRHLEHQPLSDVESWTGQCVLNAFSLHGSKVAQVIEMTFSNLIRCFLFVAVQIICQFNSFYSQINDETGVKLTYDEMWLKTIRAAQNLLKRGFKTRDVFGFMTDHSDYLVPILMASLCLACPMAPLHPVLTKDEIVRFFLKAKPSVAFCDISACDQLKVALKELPFSVKVFTFDGQFDGFEPVENLFVETGEEDRFV